MKNKKLLIKCVVLIFLVVSMGGGIFAWIYGDSTPSVEGRFQVGTDSGLIISLDPNNSLSNLYRLSSTNLLDISVNGNSIALNESSSVDGETIFVRNYSTYYETIINNQTAEIMTFDNASSNSDGNKDYIQLKFALTLNCSNTDTNTYYVYFLDGQLNGSVYHTGFRDEVSTADDSLKAMRLAMSIDGISSENYGVDFSPNTYTILANQSSETNAAADSDATNNPKAIRQLTQTIVETTSNVKANTITDMSGNYYANALGDVNLKSFSDYCLGDGSSTVSLAGETLPTYTTYGGTDPSTVKYLFKLDTASKSVIITLRIWLEGQSEYCTNGVITSDDIEKLGLYFVAFRQEPV